MSPPVVVEVTTRVPLDPEAAFALFTEEVDVWWKPGRRFRPELGEGGEMVFEPGPEGRLLERYSDGPPFVLGRVRAWEPGVRLAFSLYGRDFGPDDTTEVEVRFERDGDGTRVRVTHTGFETLASDHPARHGLDDAAYRDLMSVWWADLLVALVRGAA